MTTQTTAVVIAAKIVRLKTRRREVIADAATSQGATNLAGIALRVAEIDGRIEGLTDALEVVMARDAIGYAEIVTLAGLAGA